MARQIKQTPILKGDDAVNFIAKMEKHKKASPKEIEEMNAGFERNQLLLCR
jgi:hypothetical protein